MPVIILTNDLDIYAWWLKNSGEEAGTIYALGGNDSVEGDAGSDIFYGGSGNDYIWGGKPDPDNLLSGYWGDDRFFGDSDNDTLTGGAGHDVMYGGTGDDNLKGGGGADDLNGDDGIDTVSYTTAGIVDLLNPGLNTGIEATGDSYNLIENIHGSPYKDFLYGNNVDNVIRGSTGDDYLYGRIGNDHLFGEEGNDVLVGDPGADELSGGDYIDLVTYYYAAGPVGADLLFPGLNAGDAYGDTYDRIENLDGGPFADHLGGDNYANVMYGWDGDDLIAGRGGSDALHGLEGNDVLIGEGEGDVLDGGHGFDYASYVGSPVGLDVDLLFPGSNTAEATGDSYNEIENLLGSQFGDHLGGDDSANVILGQNGGDVITGRGGNDTLDGEGGNDTLIGEAGGDSLVGGPGDDYASYIGAPATVYVDFLTPANNSGDAAGDTYQSIENLQGSQNDDSLKGDDLANTILGQNGDDLIDGRGGRDLLNGEAGDDTLIGGAGPDILDGGAGLADTANFTGARPNYLIHTRITPGAGGDDGGLSQGKITVSVSDAVGGDGSDTLSGIEFLHFSDREVSRFGAQQNLTMNVDGGRFDDVVYRSVSTGQIIYQNMTNGAAAGFDAVTNPLSAQWAAIGTGDLSGDGKADVLIWNSTSGFVYSVLPGASASPTYGLVAGGISGNYAALGASDINGDGYTDLLVRESGSGSIFWKNAVGGVWAYVGINLGSNWSYQAAGDVNRDGCADVVVRDTSGLVYIANMANGVNSGYISLGNLTGYQVRAVADVNADGNADVIVQRESDGWTLWRDLSGNAPPWKAASNPVGTSWIVKDAADVDNDGSADLIYQNSDTGETLYRAMDAGVGTGWGIVSSPLATEWVVV